MKSIFLTIIIKLGLNKAALQASSVLAVFLTITDKIITEEEPSKILGVTIFTWIVYASTVFLDWATGITASKFESKKNNEKWEFSLSKSLDNMYKHTLFVIIIAAIYYFRKECIINNFSEVLISLLTYCQYAYFGYNMINEWISIENNRFRVTNKYTRLYRVLSRVLNIFDQAAINKVEKLTNVKEDELKK